MERISQLVTVVLVLCALVVTALSVRREFLGPPIAGKAKPVQLDNWPSLLGEGHRRGPSDADVVILEFGDFECPACAYFATTVLQPVLNKYPGRVAHVFRHWPLGYHRWARPAAEAAECAAEQRRFFEFHDALFEKRDSLGLRSFEQFAVDAAVPDLEAFQRCLGDPRSVAARIDRDIEAAEAAGGTGTPTIIINGLRLSEPPTLDELEAHALAAMEPRR